MENLNENEFKGIILLDREENIVYATDYVKELFGDEVYKSLGDYMNCYSTAVEELECKYTTVCSFCKLGKMIKEVAQNGQEKVIYNLSIRKNGMLSEMNAKISLYEDEYIKLELFNIKVRKTHSALLDTIMSKSSNLVYFKDKKLIYTYTNDSYSRLINNNKISIIGQSDIEFLYKDLITKEEYDNCIHSDIEALEEGEYLGVRVFRDKKYLIMKESIDGGILCVAKQLGQPDINMGFVNNLNKR